MPLVMTNLSLPGTRYKRNLQIKIGYRHNGDKKLSCCSVRHAVEMKLWGPKFCFLSSRIKHCKRLRWCQKTGLQFCYKLFMVLHWMYTAAINQTNVTLHLNCGQRSEKKRNNLKPENWIFLTKTKWRHQHNFTKWSILRQWIFRLFSFGMN